MEVNWSDKKESFDVIDARTLKGNFLPMVLKKAEKLEVGSGLCIVQSFEPIPLYSVMKEMGFEHIIEKASDIEYRAYFCKIKNVEPDASKMNVPFKPTAILNIKDIDPKLADIIVHFWELVWEPDTPSIDKRTKYLIGLSNAVGAGRFRQAVRELIKAYVAGVTVAEFDEVFTLFIWNQGVGTFASEIGPSPLFGAYQMIKKMEVAGNSKEDIVKKLMSDFGEKNPEVGTIFKK